MRAEMLTIVVLAGSIAAASCGDQPNDTAQEENPTDYQGNRQRSNQWKHDGRQPQNHEDDAFDQK